MAHKALCINIISKEEFFVPRVTSTWPTSDLRATAEIFPCTYSASNLPQAQAATSLHFAASRLSLKPHSTVAVRKHGEWNGGTTQHSHKKHGGGVGGQYPWDRGESSTSETQALADKCLDILCVEETILRRSPCTIP